VVGTDIDDAMLAAAAQFVAAEQLPNALYLTGPRPAAWR
jgi:hypothetical protein